MVPLVLTTSWLYGSIPPAHRQAIPPVRFPITSTVERTARRSANDMGRCHAAVDGIFPKSNRQRHDAKISRYPFMVLHISDTHIRHWTAGVERGKKLASFLCAVVVVVFGSIHSISDLGASRTNRWIEWTLLAALGLIWSISYCALNRTGSGGGVEVRL